MKKIICIICAVCTVLPLLLAASGAVDVGYEGEIDPKTGKPYEPENNPGNEQNAVIADGAFYSSEDGLYHYTVNGGEVAINIPSGGITNGDVSVFFSSGTTPSVFNNGKEIFLIKDNRLTETGRYIILFDATGRDSIEFTISGKYESLVYGFTAPSGFTITSATRNGKAISSESFIDMTEEGEYAVTYGCREAGTSHSFSFTVDHTAPVLELKGVKNGYANGPVDISDIPDDATVSLTFNGKPMKYQKELTKTGTYVIRVTDEAGNFNEYKVVISFYFNFNSFIFFGIIILIVAAVVAYIIYVRKKMRVR